MPRRPSIAVAALALLALSGFSAAAQRFTSRTLGVRVDVLVTDGHRPVAGLRAGDFELKDNGVAQRVEVVDAADVPINAVLALDTSISVDQGSRKSDLISASNALLDGLEPVDRAGLITFSQAVAPQIQPTSDIRTIRAALQRIEPHGRTSIMDGLYVALMSTLDQSARFLVVVCSDGGDTMSWLRPSEVLDASRRANAVVYAVTAADGRSSALKDLADATGGETLQVKSSSDLRPAFQRILSEFRSRYVLAYSPEGVTAGGFHKLEITLPRRKLTVKARAGYIGVEPPKQP